MPSLQSNISLLFLIFFYKFFPFSLRTIVAFLIVFDTYNFLSINDFLMTFLGAFFFGCLLITFFLCRETKDMMSAQTKLSVDTAKEVQADATLKTKVVIIM